MLCSDLCAVNEYEADAAVLAQGVDIRRHQNISVRKAVVDGGYSVVNGFVHSYVHVDRAYNISKLPVTCKSAFFIMQHLHYLSTGNFVPIKRELLACVQDEDKTVLELTIALQNRIDYDFDSAFSALFHWCQNALSRI